ncbi:sigma-E processing peptidase SpoIIGA [Clostridium sp. 'deep sea']|uniref:sigma-E processing peptidase SpoIIGA n=1 Tax=Clostridium sp. 'deep sea' TaxID=2779445 RepID=UPI0018967EB2|nr:sigma-E processing peptidase SpoIIGA [Clostridium sp. 'deep sea']QOR36213.1 sigma-E processing peptidase SpoIIGA [Clostridium sp. 'deep sea']
MWLYVDIFLIQNIVFNIVAIYFALHITGVKRVFWRILLASFIGAVYAIIVVITNVNLASNILSKIIVVLIMLKIAVPTKNLPLYFQSVIGFFIVTAVVAGLISFISPNVTQRFIVNDYFVVTNRSQWTLFFLWPFLLLLKWVYKNYITFKEWYSNTLIAVEIRLNCQNIVLNTVLDTGNQLSGMFSKTPVIVVNRNSVLAQGGNIIYDIANKIQNGESLSFEEEKIWKKCGKIIPFQVVGSDVSILPAFKPEQISYKYKKNTYLGSKALIALAPNKFFNNPDIQGLMHPVIYKSIITESREG